MRRLRESVRLEAADIALAVKKERELQDKDSQILRQELADRAWKTNIR